MIPTSALSPAELASLLHFYADAGVDWLLDDLPADRFAQFAARHAARPPQPPPRGQAMQEEQGSPGVVQRRPPAQGQGRTGHGATVSAAPRNVAMPDEQAVAAARFAAESARSLSELKIALESFDGCNLKNSARGTVFASGDPTSGIMIVGPMPDGDDDREGAPFAGRTGLLLDRMLAAIGLSRTEVLLTNIVAWRPPGNRPPSSAETEICRPFIERQIALVEPKALLLLGNFSARFFFDAKGTIHALRGQWRDVVAGGISVPAIASFHPQELLNAPAGKSLAWQDLQAFKAGFSGEKMPIL